MDASESNVYVIMYGPEGQVAPLKLGCFQNVALMWSAWLQKKSGDREKHFVLRDGPDKAGRVVHVLDPKLIVGICDANYSEEIIRRTGEELARDAKTRHELGNK